MAKSKIAKMFSKGEDFLGDTPLIAAMNVTIVEFGPQGVCLRLPYQEKLVANPATGILAGGALSAFLDNTCGCAVAARTDREHNFATLDLRIDYMKPATPGDDVLAFAECYKLTRRIAFVRGVAYHKKRDEPIANATATFMFTGAPDADTRGNL